MTRARPSLAAAPGAPRGQLSDGWRGRPRPGAKDGQVQGRRKGYYTTQDPETGKIVEKETFSCGHCQHVTILEHAARLDDVGVFCLGCMRPCCKGCAAKMANGGMCDPFEAKHARAQAADALKRQVAT